MTEFVCDNVTYFEENGEIVGIEVN